MRTKLSLDDLRRLECAGKIITNGITRDFNKVIFDETIPVSFIEAIKDYHISKEILFNKMKELEGFCK